MCIHEILKFGCLKLERPIFSNADLGPHFDTLFHRTINFWVPQKILKKKHKKRKSQRNLYPPFKINMHLSYRVPNVHPRLSATPSLPSQFPNGLMILLLVSTSAFFQITLCSNLFKI